MSGVDGASWNNKTLDVVSLTFQVRNTISEFHVDDSSNIFANDPSWLSLPNDTKHFRPEVTVIFLALLLPGDTERLA